MSNRSSAPVPVSKPLTAAQLKRLADAYADAAVDRSWMGASEPSQFAGIEKRYRNARRNLYLALESLFATPATEVVPDAR